MSSFLQAEIEFISQNTESTGRYYRSIGGKLGNKQMGKGSQIWRCPNVFSIINRQQKVWNLWANQCKQFEEKKIILGNRVLMSTQERKMQLPGARMSSQTRTANSSLPFSGHQADQPGGMLNIHCNLILTASKRSLLGKWSRALPPINGPASPGSLLEIQNFRRQPRPTETAF